MLSRVSIFIVLFSSMGFGGFALGHLKAHVAQQESDWIPPEHPISIALEAKKELGLKPDQLAKLEALHRGLSDELAPFKREVDALEAKAAGRSGSQPDPAVVSEVHRRLEELMKVVKPIMERYGDEVAKVLSGDQKDKLGRIANERMARREMPDFPLMMIMEHRSEFGLTPAQFTKLQLLQAEFIVNFAPVREQLEMIQIQAEKFAAKGQEPPQEIRVQAQPLEARIRELKALISHRAIAEVLTPEQRQKLAEKHHGTGDRARN